MCLRNRDSVEQNGVSNVIGVMLMIGVTVALVALTTVIVFDIGGDVGDKADATIDMNQNGDTVKVRILENQNVEKFTLKSPSGETSTASSVGELMNTEVESGTFLVVATLETGEEQVIHKDDVSI